MEPKIEFLQSHTKFHKPLEQRTGLEREIIYLECQVSWLYTCIYEHPNDEEWKTIRREKYNTLIGLQHQWRKDNKLLGETEAVQLTFDF